MLKFSNMSATIFYSKCMRLFVKNKSGYSKKAENIKRLMREQKEMFGPLLENSKKRKKKNLPLQQSGATAISTTNDNDNEKKLEQLSKNSEFLWTVKSMGSKKIKIIKVSGKENEFNTLSHDKIELGETKITVDANSLTSSTNFEAKLKNFHDSDIIKFPIFNTQKTNEDNWNTSEIVTQPLMESRNFSLPGVTRILSETMSEEAKLMLENWKKKMILKLGVEGFEKYSQALLEDSKIIHSLIGDTLKKEKVDVPERLKPTYNSIKLILKDITDVRLIESHVVHPTLGYRGIVDCVASYRGNLCVIDWKKSEKIKTLSSIYDSPLQLSAYIGALNSDPNYPFKVKTGILGIAYVEGQPPSIFEFTGKKLEFYWKEWLKRVEKYHFIKSA
ncbi:mitochondrial genome maintenance exonuclease 1-like isoform X1 [Cotesia glomerata]|uniref:Mitochondrial genome maintenance exonuclease 1 n=1 Tax=Cotesia glomerata TaxID=32391 RepID=A0AAV7INA6_COTGL|nr:mitochondrial genome maintenance exonuclease 1-like isoform X1 [Cotesia glomerata]XP_044583332.1 mitochondrial genome maintenance exonuclease 1-like isoform X1 [Cotesia glomerata]KAH0554105.1 hypothetical protein KQX54_007627 [Cotesia glomerata]